MSRSRTFLTAAAIGLSFLLGCGEERELPGMSRKTVPIAEVPENVLSVAKKEIPGVDFNESWQNLDRDGKLNSYEIRGRASNGKIREVRVSPTGAILEKE